MTLNEMVRVKYKLTPTTAAPMIAYFPGGSRSKILLHMYITEGVLIKKSAMLCTIPFLGDYGMKSTFWMSTHELSSIFHAL